MRCGGLNYQFFLTLADMLAEGGFLCDQFDFEDPRKIARVVFR
jgi:hypothetical protein